MARVQVTSYFKINSTNQKVVTHFLILIDRGMQEEDICVFSEPEDDISASSFDWLQITNDF